MKLQGLLDGPTSVSLRLDWLATELEPVTDYGRRFFEELQPFVPGEEAACAERAQSIAAFALTVDAARVDAMREALRGAPDISGAIARASMGDLLSDVNFLEVLRFCDSVARADTLLEGQAVIRVLRCDEVVGALERGRSGKFGFYLDDTFDAPLAAARAELRSAEDAFDAARARLGRETDEFIIMRDEVHGALPPGVRVIREAPTYFLCEVELDEAALQLLAARDAAARRAAAAEEGLRTHLSGIVRRHSRTLEEATHAAGRADFFLAAARYTQRYGCVAASSDDAAFTFEDGRYLPVQSELDKEHLPYTPVSVSLSDVAVLTGPNMGGKSVALRTCGAIAVSAAFGLPVPAARANVPLFARIAWLGIGANSEAGGLLSSFAREVVRLRDAMKIERRPALWLIDEFARTTTPAEGRALLLALIEGIRERNIYAFVATHLSGIAATAGVPHYAVRGLRGIPEAAGDNLNDALASLARSMDYTIHPVSADREAPGDAIMLAALLGLDRTFTESAWQMLARGETEAP